MANDEISKKNEIRMTRAERTAFRHSDFDLRRYRLAVRLKAAEIDCLGTSTGIG